MKAWGMTFGAQTDCDSKGGCTDGYFRFFTNGNKYIITKFQRPYTWTEYQIRGILDDIEYIRATGKEVGWPSILIQQHQADDQPNAKIFDLGDGQQRVISVALALLAIWHRGHALRDMYKASDEEALFLKRIVPLENDPLIAPFLGSRRTNSNGVLSIEPVIEFSSEKTNKEFKSLFIRLTEEKLADIKAQARDDTNTNSRLYNAFNIYFDHFESFNIKDLEKCYNILLTKITLTVLQYNEEEDMQRAFSNMNSFGIALSEGELIKAELYGVAKKIDFALAEEVADYWIVHLETPFWKTNWSTAKGVNYLDYCLEQSFNSYNNWAGINLEYEKMRTTEQKNKHLLRDLWRHYLTANVTTLEEFRFFWEELKKDFHTFETSLTNASFAEGSPRWELNYAYQIVGKSIHTPSILSIFMRLNRHLSIEDFVKSIRLITKYIMYAYVVKQSNPNNIEASIRPKTSPILQDRMTYNEIVEFLENLKVKRQRWMSEDNIKKTLTTASYDKSYNAVISELFIYALNEKKRENGLTSSLFNTKKLDSFDAEKSREHIMPQKLRVLPDDYDEVTHVRYVGMLGNVLVLSKEANSKANNREVIQKLTIYQEEKNQSAWGSYITDFIIYWERNKTWGYSDIKEQSETTARIFARVLSPVNPNAIDESSVFKELIFTLGFKAQDVFYVREKASLAEVPLILTENGTLAHGEEIITATDKLEVITGTRSKNWRNILFFREEDGSPSSITKRQKKLKLANTFKV